MKKRMKKILALGLAAAMTFGMSATAMAAETAAPEAAVEAEADDQAAVDAVTDAAETDAASAEGTEAADQSEAAQSAHVTDAAAEEAAPDETAAEETTPAEEAGTVEAGEDASVVTKAPQQLNGIVQAEDGNFYLFRNGVVDTTATTLALYNGVWWYVDCGMIDFNFEGLCEYGDVWWYVQNGQVQFGYNGFVYAKKDWDEDWYYIHNGRIDENYTDVVLASRDGKDGWYYIENGQMGPTDIVAANEWGWWYIGEDHTVDFEYTGIGYNGNGGWYIQNGQVDFTRNDPWEESYTMDNGKEMPYQYYFKNGKVDESITGVYWTEVNKKWGWHGYYEGELASGYTRSGMVLPNEMGWWYIDTYGNVDFDAEGIGYNDNGEWYVKNGQVDFSKNGLYDSGEDMDEYPMIAQIVNGRVDSNYTGVYWTQIRGKWDSYGFLQGELTTNLVLSNSQGWWYVGDEGRVDFSYNGIGNNENGTWKITNGAVDFGYTGTMKVGESSENLYLYVTNGFINYDLYDVIWTSVDNEYAWWEVSGGYINKTSYDVACNSRGWWYIADGKVDFNYTGNAFNENGEWYIKNGQVAFDYTGILEQEYGAYYVENGRFMDEYNGVVRGVVDGVDGWWAIENGSVEKGYDGIECNKNGTWYYEDGKVDFNANGTYVIRQQISYDDYNVDFCYILQVSGGLVTDVRVVSPDSQEVAM